ncbi:Hypothetical predicted protein [Xyrichtys novacula]|uniref:Uncharacterized protein n=1 Tax=Xyrichtys novacula TaxID=13765 RepID=A0AAV1FCB2_XYRNO|nr:Hypothetical predicted protein [Xyrichtys novacula]
MADYLVHRGRGKDERTYGNFQSETEGTWLPAILQIFTFSPLVLQRFPFNTHSVIAAAFEEPLMRKLKDALAVSDKTLRRLQKELIKQRSPSEVFMSPFFRVS